MIAPQPAKAPRLSRLLRGIGALVVLIAVVVGVPVLMTKLNLVPHSVPSLHQLNQDLRQRDNGQLVGVVLAAGVWLCWALFTVSLIPELAAIARQKPSASLPGLGVFQRPAGALVTAIVIGFTIAPLITGAATVTRASATGPPLPPASAVSIARPAAAAATVHPDSARSDPAATRPVTATASNPRTSPTYEVQRRDTLWAIAARYLQDPLRYREIAQLNPALVGPDNEITTGSVLTLPTDATGLPHPTTETSTAAGVTGDTEVIVAPGDTLWDIEQRVTGNGANWPQGFHANQDRAEPHGESFTDPDLIRPGWTLDIPNGTAPGGPTATTQPPTDTPPVPSPTAPTNPTSPPPPASPTAPVNTQPDQPAAPQTPATPAEQETAPARASAATQPVEPTPAAHGAAAGESAVLAFTGGGLLLAGVSLSALMLYRRRQFQRRHPGRAVGGSPPELIGMERAVLAAGDAGMADVTWLDEALRSLVQSIAAQPGGGRLPDVIAVRITDLQLTLVLTAPAPTAPQPWQVDEDGTRWTIQREDALPYDPRRRDAHFAPFPTLASVGYTQTREHWLLDLERIGALSLAGDAQRCLDLVRFLAAELAHNNWSEMLQVTMVGFGQELVAANPDRLTYTEDLAGALTTLSRRLEAVHAAMRAIDVDVLDGRLHDIVGDQWAPIVLMIAPHLAADPVGLDALLAAMTNQSARASVALVLAEDRGRGAAAGWQLNLDEDGTLVIPVLGLELIAQQIPADEAAQLAQLLALAAGSDDEPVPPARGDQPWDRYADAHGGLTRTGDSAAPSEHPSDVPDGSADDSQTGGVNPDRAADTPAAPALYLADDAPARSNSALPLSPQAYLDSSATTAQDLQALAPVVDERIRDEVEQSDPDLDEDLAAWQDASSPRPKLRLLGPVRVWAQGSLPERSPQVAFHTEVVAYLATRSNGVLSSEYAELMWPDDPDVVGKPKVRQSIAIVRRWLGSAPHTGVEYLPSGLFEASTARYRITGLLCDAELFRRLRLRGLARGAHGIDDLWRALALVEGRPFADIPGRREKAPGGYVWLTEANQRLDFEYSAMIVDTAHTVATYHFGAGEPHRAAAAAQTALRGGTYEDVPLLDLVQACLVQEKEAEAEAYVRQLLANSGVEREEDLQPRTAEVLFRLRRRWRDRAS